MPAHGLVSRRSPCAGPRPRSRRRRSSASIMATFRATSMRCACIDIGSNTTRLLVAEAARGRLDPVVQQRAFTRIGRADRRARRDPRRDDRRRRGGRRGAARRAPRRAGAAHAARRRDRRDPARRATATRWSPRCATRAGVEVAVLSGDDEGAARVRRRDAHARPRRRTGTIAVVDVGGMSTEIAVGTMAGGVTWLRSFAIGSGALAGRCRDGPAVAGGPRGDARRGRRGVRRRPTCRRLDHAVAVGGSAASLPTLVGPVLDARARSSARSACSAPRRPRRSRAATGSRRSARSCCRRAYWCSTRPPGGSGCRCGSAAAGCAKAWSSSSRAGLRAWPRRRTSTSHPSSPTGSAAARIVRVRADELFEHAEGVLDTRDIERVHDMRVASRRLRAVLEIFAPCFPQSEFKGVLRDVKQLADALGERRDPDVHIDALQAFARALLAGQQARRRAARRGPARAPGARQRGARRRARARAASAGCTGACSRSPTPPTAPDPARSRREGPPGRGARSRRRAGRQRRADRARAAGRAVLVHAAPPPTRTRSSRCTTCGSPPSACATSSRSPGPCFGPYAETATKHGQGPAGPARRDPRLRRADPRDRRVRRAAAGRRRRSRCARRPATAEDLDPALLKQAPHARDHAGRRGAAGAPARAPAAAVRPLPRAVGGLRAQGLPRAARVRGRASAPTSDDAAAR